MLGPVRTTARRDDGTVSVPHPRASTSFNSVSGQRSQIADRYAVAEVQLLQAGQGGGGRQVPDGVRVDTQGGEVVFPDDDGRQVLVGRPRRKPEFGQVRQACQGR
jgi:hypothetical protein